MAVGSIDLFRTAEVVLVATVLVHFCLLRPWNARADLLLTVEMIDKDLTAEIDRGSLPVDDPVVADLQRCLSLSRKRADAAESLANLLALLSPAPRAVAWSREDLWPSSDRLDRLDRLDHSDRLGHSDRLAHSDRLDHSDRLERLTAGEQHILLEYSAELSAATSAYLRLTSWPRIAAQQSFSGRSERLVGAGGALGGSGRGGPDGVRHGNGVRHGWSLLRRPARDLTVTSAQQPKQKPQPEADPEPVEIEVEAPRILDLSIGAGRETIDDELELRTAAERVPVQPAGYEPRWDEYFQEGRSAGDRSLSRPAFAERPVLHRPVIERPATERPFSGSAHPEQPFPERPFAERYFDEDIFDEPAEPVTPAEPAEPQPSSSPTERTAEELASQRPHPERPYQRLSLDRASLDRLAANRLMNENRAMNQPRPPEDHD